VRKSAIVGLGLVLSGGPWSGRPAQASDRASGETGGLQSVVLDAAKDNSLVEVADGSLSLALSPFIFAGRVGNHGGGATLRRGLIAFDIESAIPAGADIVSVRLDVVCTQTNTEGMIVSLHRALADWGEGTSKAPGGGGGPSTPGDATWIHTFWPDQLWANIGGDFAPEPSAATEIALPGPYAWESTRGLVADVQSWLDDPASNFGWIIIGNEEFLQSVKALASRHYKLPDAHPRLTIEYLAPAPVMGDLNGDQLVNGADLGLLLAAWGPCGDPQQCPGDYDGDGSIGGADLGVLLSNWSR
jgi:hypothetical protein